MSSSNSSSVISGPTEQWTQNEGMFLSFFQWAWARQSIHGAWSCWWANVRNESSAVIVKPARVSWLLSSQRIQPTFDRMRCKQWTSRTVLRLPKPSLNHTVNEHGVVTGCDWPLPLVGSSCWVAFSAFLLLSHWESVPIEAGHLPRMGVRADIQRWAMFKLILPCQSSNLPIIKTWMMIHIQ